MKMKNFQNHSHHSKNFQKIQKNIDKSENIMCHIRQKIHSHLELKILTESEKEILQSKGDATAKKIFEKFPELTPTYHICLDGIDFYFSYKIDGESKQLFFVKRNGRIEPRVSRLSGSGKKMHIFPGYDSKNLSRYSKGDTTWKFDYESGVLTDERLQTILEQLPSGHKKIPNFWQELRKCGYTSEHYETEEYLQEFEKIPLFGQNSNYTLSGIRIYCHQLNEVRKQEFIANPMQKMKAFFENLPFENTGIFEKFLKNHQEFWKWTKFRRLSKPDDDVQKWQLEVGEYQGQLVSATLCYHKNNENLCWIESFDIENSPMTSFGIKKHRISGGLLTAKPYEYFQQIPNFIREDLKAKHPDTHFDENATYDIRAYLQDNPLIIAFKKLRIKYPEKFEK